MVGFETNTEGKYLANPSMCGELPLRAHRWMGRLKGQAGAGFGRCKAFEVLIFQPACVFSIMLHLSQRRDLNGETWTYHRT